MAKYCPIITKALEGHQNQTYCLERDCAWWEPIIGECSIKTLARYMRRSDARQDKQEEASK